MDIRSLGTALRALATMAMSLFFLFLAACGDEGNNDAGNGNTGGNNAATTMEIPIELPAEHIGQILINGQPACMGETSCMLEFPRDIDPSLGFAEVGVMAPGFVFVPKVVMPDAPPTEVTWDRNVGDLAVDLSGSWIRTNKFGEEDVTELSTTLGWTENDEPFLFAGPFGIPFVSEFVAEGMREDRYTWLVYDPANDTVEVHGELLDGQKTDPLSYRRPE